MKLMAAALLLLLAAACGIPGVDVARAPGDFAVLEILLQG
jgi:hypothetical protein